ncbi:MAG: hypothetical protein B6U75_02235 [Desulfurococcales archaeon ex4484_217_1]|nr:MAG: hypothetical protein B6U75_02235 [Desulfurococcales archaeon ex4484_217_1]
MIVYGVFEEIKDRISSILSGKRAFILGIGNELRGDDYVGSYIALNLKLRGLKNVVDAGLSPESFLEVAARTRPDAVVFIDAVEASLEPGTIVFASVEEVEKSEIVFPTTHKPSYSMLYRYLKFRLPKAEQYLLGVQVVDTSFGKNMTETIKRIADKLIDFLSTLVQ